MENASSAKIINHTLKYSSVLWDKHVVTLRLQENVRVKNEMNKLPTNTELL
jgi:chaperonin cofactor prefoldin